MADRSRRGGRSQSASQPARIRSDADRFGARWRERFRIQELMLKQKRLGNEGTGTPRSEQTSQASDEMDEQDDQIAHQRIVAGREIPTNYERNNNSPATYIGAGLPCPCTMKRM